MQVFTVICWLRAVVSTSQPGLSHVCWTLKLISVNTTCSVSLTLNWFHFILSYSKPVKLVKPKNVSSPESSLASSSIMPCEENAATSSSLDSSTPTQSSYVMSALRKFEWELFLFSLCVIPFLHSIHFHLITSAHNHLLSLRPLNPTENTPVKSGSNLAKRFGTSLCSG